MNEDILKAKSLLSKVTEKLDNGKIVFVQRRESNKQAKQIQSIVSAITDRAFALPSFMDKAHSDIVFYIAEWTRGETHHLVCREGCDVDEVDDDTILKELGDYLAEQAYLVSARSLLKTNRLDHWIADAKIELI